MSVEIETNLYNNTKHLLISTPALQYMVSFSVTGLACMDRGTLAVLLEKETTKIVNQVVAKCLEGFNPTAVIEQLKGN